MKLWFKYVIIFQLFCILFIELNECKNSKTNVKDKCDLRKFEDSVPTMWRSLFDWHKKWPSNGIELDILCKASLTSTRYVKSYADNCLKGLSKFAMAYLASSIRKTDKNFCKNKQARKRIIDNSICVTKAQNDTIKCWNQTLPILEIIKDLKVQKDKLPLMCCTYHLCNDCIYNAFEKYHPGYCSNDNIMLLDELFKKATSFRIVCPDYGDRNKCNNYFDKIGKYAKSDVKSSYRTHYPLMWKIIETL